MSARHGVADTGEFRQKESVAATKKIRKKEKECVLRRCIYRKNRLISGSRRRT